VKALKVMALVVILVLMVVSFTTLQLGVDVRLTLLRPDFLVESLADVGVLDLIPDLAMEYIGEFFRAMPPDISEHARAAWYETVTPAWLATQLQAILRDALLFASGKQPALTVTLNTGELRDSFLAAFSSRVDAYSARMMAQVLSGIPDVVGPESPELADLVPDDVPPEVVRALRLVTLAPLAAAAAVCLLALACLALARGAGAARWVGTAAILSGLGAVAGVIAAQRFLLPALLAGLSLGDVPPFLAGLDPQAIGLGLSERVLAVVRLTGLATLGVGVVLHILPACRFRARPAQAGAATETSDEAPPVNPNA